MLEKLIDHPKTLLVDDMTSLDRLSDFYSLVFPTHNIETVSTTEKALEKVTSTGYDLVIASTKLPKSDDDKQLFSEIKEMYGLGLPVVFLSEDKNIENAKKIIRAGAASYINTPLNPIKFKELINGIILSGRNDNLNNLNILKLIDDKSITGHELDYLEGINMFSVNTQSDMLKLLRKNLIHAIINFYGDTPLGGFLGSAYPHLRIYDGPIEDIDLLKDELLDHSYIQSPYLVKSAYKKPSIIGVTGPKGVGKTTIVNGIMNSRRIPNTIKYVTREPRPYECNSKDHIFCDDSSLDRLVDEKNIIEFTNWGERIGIDLDEIDSYISEGSDVIFTIPRLDIVKQLRQIYPDMKIANIVPNNYKVIQDIIKERDLFIRDEKQVIDDYQRFKNASYELATFVNNHFGNEFCKEVYITELMRVISSRFEI
ncbi:hypothetical protein C0585_08125 [Candidatus Woesearchaeota archaeon]|nr:MAG: hypothetical protein C0585_08125 [Candidatus Woesearchaeota archaeon]